MKKIKLILILFISLITLLFNVSCTQVIIGGATSGGIILVQERTPEQAAKDILIKTRLEEAFFSTNYDDIFSKIKIIVFEAKSFLLEQLKVMSQRNC